MTSEEKIAFIHSQIACANIELESMKAANLQRVLIGDPPIYEEEDMLNLIDKYQLGHNSVIMYFNV